MEEVIYNTEALREQEQQIRLQEARERLQENENETQIAKLKKKIKALFKKIPMRVGFVEIVIVMLLASFLDGLDYVFYLLGAGLLALPFIGEVGIAILEVAGNILDGFAIALIVCWALFRGIRKRYILLAALGSIELIPFVGDILPTFMAIAFTMIRRQNRYHKEVFKKYKDALKKLLKMPRRLKQA